METDRVDGPFVVLEHAHGLVLAVQVPNNDSTIGCTRGKDCVVNRIPGDIVAGVV